MRLHRSPDGAVTGATLTAPVPLTIGANIAPEIAAACASLLPSDFPGVPVVAGVGVNQVFAEVTDRAALARASPDPSAFREAKSRVPAIGDHFALHLYVRDPGHPSRIRARMFAPLLGVPEDPATGSANASLAALLVARSGDAEGAFEIEQGVEMGRPSLLRAAAWREPDGSVRARIGGNCVTMLRGSIEL
jgi:trans-2,3-dihydro-3-hydroxyanthranilate isomerase